jgi:nicotinate-nucleotide adenylyltransferase
LPALGGRRDRRLPRLGRGGLWRRLRCPALRRWRGRGCNRQSGAVRAFSLRRRNIFSAIRANPIEHSYSNVYELTQFCCGPCIKTVLVALSFQYRSFDQVAAKPARVAILPGAWNPPTVAHLAIAKAAAGWADEVILLLPKAFPHKEFHGAGFEQRLAVLVGLAASEPGISVAVAQGGLYMEMAAETAEYFGPGTEIGLLCGRDAAERITLWNYGRPGVFEEMIAEYPLLVAARSGEYVAAQEHAQRVVSLPMDESFSEVSSTEVRRRIANGLSWKHLVPNAIRDEVARVWGRLG